MLTILVQLGFDYIPYFANMTEEDLNGMTFVILYLMQIAIFLVPLLIIIKRNQWFRFRDFGFEKVKITTCLKYAFLGYVFYFIVMAIVTHLEMSFGVEELPGFQRQESHIPVIGDQQTSAIMVVTIITFIAPILEEIFFRGFVFKTMLKKWAPWLAFIMSSLIFAAIHFEFQSIIPLFILGLIMNWIFYRTKSLYPGIFFHIINNIIALSIEYYIYLNPEILEMV